MEEHSQSHHIQPYYIPTLTVKSKGKLEKREAVVGPQVSLGGAEQEEQDGEWL